ncbi:MAG: hypothetical protein KIS83_11145 [Rubrivivax sp.]|nr:hypothetical protein [Rubrivivax sp.]
MRRSGVLQSVRIGAWLGQVLAAMLIIFVPAWRGPGLLGMMVAAMAVSLYLESRRHGAGVYRMTLRQIHERFASGQLRSNAWDTLAMMLSLIALAMHAFDLP